MSGLKGFFLKVTDSALNFENNRFFDHYLGKNRSKTLGQQGFSMTFQEIFLDPVKLFRE